MPIRSAANLEGLTGRNYEAALARLGLELILAPWLWEMNPKMVRRRVRIDFSPLNVSVANIWRAFASARFQSRIRLIAPSLTQLVTRAATSGDAIQVVA